MFRLDPALSAVLLVFHMHVFKACAVGLILPFWLWGEATTDCVLRVYRERVGVPSKLGRPRGPCWRRPREMKC